MTKYIFVDESGDNSLNEKASDFLIFAGVMIDASKLEATRNAVSNIITRVNDQKQKKNAKSIHYLHAHKLDHKTLIYLYSELAKLDLQAFCFVSPKETFDEGQVKENNWDVPQKLYNKCVALFCELIGGYLNDQNLPKDSTQFVLEARKNHDYEKLRKLLQKTTLNPKTEKVERLVGFRFGSHFKAQEKNEEPLLSLADLVASAVWKSLVRNESNFQTVDFSYFREIKHLFPCDAQGKRLEYSVHIIKHYKIDWDPRQRRFIKFLEKDPKARDSCQKVEHTAS